MCLVSIADIDSYKIDGSVAQLVEQRPFKPRVTSKANVLLSYTYNEPRFQNKNESDSGGTVETKTKSQTPLTF